MEFYLFIYLLAMNTEFWQQIWLENEVTNNDQPKQITNPNKSGKYIFSHSS